MNTKKKSRVEATTRWQEWPFYLRVDEVGVLLGISPSAVRAAIQRGDIPAKRSGSLVLVKRDDLVQALERSA